MRNLKIPLLPRGQEPKVADPLQPVNRAMFWVNDKLYFYAAQACRPCLPGHAAAGAEIGRQFFYQSRHPGALVNSLAAVQVPGSGK